jgi:hypothetical protein
MKHTLSEATLEIREFCEKYPLISDGLVVALSGENQLLVASYGKPPLAAVLLRPEGNVFKFIGRSSDDTVKALDIQDGDIVVVGPLGKILKLEDLELNASNASDIVSKAIYDPKTDKSICIVASISSSHSLQLRNTATIPCSPPVLHNKKAKNSPAPLLSSPEPNVLSFKSFGPLFQSDEQNESMQHKHASTTLRIVNYSGPVLQKSPDSLSETTSKTPEERAMWFFTKQRDYSLSQDSGSGSQLPIFFSQRCYQGVVSFQKQKRHMSGRNVFMGLRVSQDRIILLDGWGTKNLVSRKRDMKWIKHDLSEETLEIERFRKLGYPLKSEGLVAATSGDGKLLVASYGKPPLGVILLRPGEGGWLKVINRSSDDTVKTLNVQDGDIVAVGSFEKIMGLKDLEMDASSASEVVSKAIYDPKTDKSICIVTTISARQSPKPIQGLSRQMVRTPQLALL